MKNLVGKSYWFEYGAIIFLLILPFIAGCTTEEYFPHELGDEWTYKINIMSENGASFYGETYWMGARGDILQKWAGNIPPKECSNNCNLKIKIVDCSNKTKTPEIVTLAILQDDLKIFYGDSGFNGLFWEKIDSDNNIWVQKIAYNSKSFYNPYNTQYYLDTSYGYSARIIFSNLLETGLSLDGEGRDEIQYIGLDSNVPPCYSDACMHFRRVVRSDMSAFSEDTWFAKNKGLVYLIQQRNNQTTMIWDLEKYSKSNYS